MCFITLFSSFPPLPFLFSSPPSNSGQDIYPWMKIVLLFLWAGPFKYPGATEISKSWLKVKTIEYTDLASSAFLCNEHTYERIRQWPVTDIGGWPLVNEWSRNKKKNGWMAFKIWTAVLVETFLFRGDSFTRGKPPISLTGQWRFLSYMHLHIYMYF